MEHQEITYVPAKIQFGGFDEYRRKAIGVADFICAITLTETNVKEVKGTLADARKLVNALEDRRKAIKREVLAPYKAFEEQVKEITGIIDAADADLRSQVRELEERQREAKKERLKEIWGKRAGHYNFPKYIPDAFERWLEPVHLNKSTSMKACEDSMSVFMERAQRDVNAILKMEDAMDIMAEYAGCLDMTEALEAVRTQKEYKARAFQEEKPATETATFLIIGKANITLTEKLLQENGIEYRRI